MFAVLRERVWEVGGADTGRLLRHRVLLLQHGLLLADLSEPGVLQGLAGRDAVVRVVDKKLLDQVDDLGARLRNQLGDALALYTAHAELGEVHVRGVSLELIEQGLVGRAQNVMNFVHLVEFVVPGEEREQRDDLEHDAADAPQIHLVAIVAVGEEALGRAVPPCRDVLRVRLLRIDTAAGAKVGEFNLVLHQKNVLRLDVTMEDAVAVHVVDRLHELVHVVFDALLRQVVAASLDSIVHVHLHEFEDERQAPGRLIVEHLVQLDDLGVRR